MRLPFFNSDSPPRVSSDSLSAFTKQLSTLVDSGVPLHRALEALARDDDEDAEPIYRVVVPELLKHITHGHRFSRGLAAFPTIFPPTYIALIEAAEKTGALVYVLDQISQWLDRTTELSRKIKKALTYPAFVLALCLVLTVALFHSVIPGILETTSGLGVEFPLPTRILSAMVAAVRQPLLWLAAGLFTVALLAYVRTEEGRYRLQAATMLVPILGPITIYSSASRYSFTLGMLTGAGVDISQASRNAAQASGSMLMEEDSLRVYRLIREGKNLSDIMEEQVVYPGLLRQLVRLGEEVGRFDKFLNKAAKMMEEDTSHRLDRLTILLEPLILAGLSLFVGFVLLSTLMPLANLAGSL